MTGLSMIQSCLHNRSRLLGTEKGHECTFGGLEGEPCTGVCPNWATSRKEWTKKYGTETTAVIDFLDLMMKDRRWRGILSADPGQEQALLGVKEVLEAVRAPRPPRPASTWPKACGAKPKGQSALSQFGDE